MERRSTTRMLRILATLLVLCVAAQPRATYALTAVTVTDCSSDAQLRSTLAALEAGSGGTLTFGCGTAAIVLTGGPLPTISQNTTIDGGNTITLSGNNATRLFSVDPGATLTLNNITLTKGLTSSDDGGAIINRGTLYLNGSQLTGNQTTGSYSGGAIASYGQLVITTSQFHQNKSGSGGAISVFAGSLLTLTTSNLSGNDALSRGGALYVTTGATATLQYVSLATNGLLPAPLPDYGGGGAINNSGRLSISKTSLSQNTVANPSLPGGAIANYTGTVTIDDSIVAGNSAYAGGLSNRNGGELVISNTVIAENSGDIGGIWNSGSTLELTNSTIRGNHALNLGSGGGVSNNVGQLIVSGTTFSGNTSVTSGGALYNSGGVLMVNSTLSGNSVQVNGGGIEANNFGAIGLLNVTLNGNSAGNQGGGIDEYSPTAGYSLTLRNTLIANSPSGGNCAHSGSGTGTIASSGFNLSTDGSCAAYLDQSSDWNNAVANLGPLANNGGPTLTHVPFPPSSAIDQGSACPPTDQRGITRAGKGLACDIGAVEYVPGEKSPWLLLPLIVR